jgi:GTP-binding protein
MKIKSAEFSISNSRADRCPDGNMPEFAFIGRSNVGKSSLINMLTGRKGLAMTSSTPGKTMLINHFVINNEWYLVDLPGYGYAKRSKRDTEALGRMIKYYVTERSQLTSLFVLVDSRHTPQKIDLDFITMLGEEGVPFAIIFTKADKSSASTVAQNVKTFCKKMLETWEEMPPYFVTSSENGRGREDVLGFIEKVIHQVGEE